MPASNDLNAARTPRPEPAMARAWAALRDEGPRIFGLKLASELGYRKVLVLGRSLSEAIPAIESRLPLRVELLPAAAVDDYLAFRPNARRDRILSRWDAGDLCFVARYEGRIVACGWGATAAWTDYLQCAIELAPGDAYLFDGYTLPDWRGRGVFQTLGAEQLRALQRAGHRRAIRATAVQNTVALHTHSRGGFRPIGSLVRYRLGPWQWIIRR
jgi:GNAT superfamily N-acetyltransferase